MTDQGQATSALDWIVLKVVQRCNLNCTYCYVYNRGDSSWITRPPIISNDVVRVLSRRIATHCKQYGISTFVIELHGGEPLLLGKARMQTILDLLREQCGDVTLRFLLQTNGLLLDQEWLELFEKNQICFGLSLDGPPELADTRRVKHDGTGSTTDLLSIIARLRALGPQFDRLSGGVLCVANPSINGGRLVHWFVDNGFKVFDLLLPDGNYVNLPSAWKGPEPYLRFLTEAFDEWYSMGSNAPRIRIFETFVMSFLGIRTTLDSFGGDLKRLCVVESNGSIGVVDTIRFCGGIFAQDTLSIFDSPLDRHALYFDLDNLQEACSTCKKCKYFSACGGGYLPHRYDGRTFANPSLYCEALYGLAEHIWQHMLRDLPQSLQSPGRKH